MPGLPRRKLLRAERPWQSEYKMAKAYDFRAVPVTLSRAENVTQDIVKVGRTRRAILRQTSSLAYARGDRVAGPEDITLSIRNEPGTMSTCSVKQCNCMSATNSGRQTYIVLESAEAAAQTPSHSRPRRRGRARRIRCGLGSQPVPPRANPFEVRSGDPSPWRSGYRARQLCTCRTTQRRAPTRTP